MTVDHTIGRAGIGGIVVINPVRTAVAGEEVDVERPNLEHIESMRAIRHTCALFEGEAATDGDELGNRQLGVTGAALQQAVSVIEREATQGETGATVSGLEVDDRGRGGRTGAGDAVGGGRKVPEGHF